MMSYSNTINRAISTIQPIMSISNVVNSITNPMLSYMNSLNEILKNFDFDEFHLRLISELLSEKQDYYEKFLEENIFPSVFYIDLDVEFDDNDININEYLKREDLKQYYSDRISSWRNDDIEGYPNELIDDIL